MTRFWFVFMGIMGAAVVGIAFGSVIEHFWTNQPKSIAVRIIGVQPSPTRPGYDIAVQLTVPPTPDCLRLSEHMLYRGNYPREVVVLTTSFTGLNFISQRSLVEMKLLVPGYVPDGRWNYVNRSLYLCVQFGLMTRVSQFESEPVAIDLPPHE